MSELFEIIKTEERDDMAAFRNEALKKSHAKYVMFAAPGMKVDEKGIALMAEQMEKTSAKMVSCGYRMYAPDEEGSPELVYETPEFNRRFLDKDDMLCRLFYQTHYQGFVFNKLFKRSVIRNHHLKFAEDIPGSEEMLFVVEYIKKAGDAIMLPGHYTEVSFVPSADLGLELEAFYRMQARLKRHPDAQWLCEQSIEMLEEELEDDAED